MIFRTLEIGSVFFVFLFFISTVTVGVSAEPVEQQSANSPATGESCNSLDVIFIVDQSGSMGGEGSLLPNDPDGQRKYAVDWAIDWLTDNALDVCPDAVHRVSVISFGSAYEVDLTMAEINPNNTAEWTYIRENLKESVTLKNLGYTNPLGAFIKAKMLFDEYPPSGDIVPKRVIVYLTDGQPDPESGSVRYLEYANLMRDWVNGDVKNVNDVQQFALYKHSNGNAVWEKLPNNILEGLPFDSTLLDLEMCLEEQRDTYGPNIPAENINACYEENPVTDESFQNSTYIYTMLLSYGSSWPQSIKNVFKDISESHGGISFDITDNKQDIPGRFLDIFTELSGVEVTRLACDNFAVNPFVSQARMTFFKINPDDETRIYYTDADGVDHVLTSNNLESEGFDVVEHLSGSNERFVINNPYPGIWRFDADTCNGIDAYYESVQIDVSGGLNPVRLWSDQQGYLLPDQQGFPEYDIDPFYNVDNPYYITYELSDIEGSVLEEIPNPSIVVDANAKVSLPDGTSETYAMLWDEDLKKYRTEDPLVLPMPGEYHFSIKGTVPYREIPYGPVTTQSIDDVFTDTLELFDVEDLTFTVYEVLPIKVTGEVSNNTIHNDLFTNKFKWPLSLNPIEVFASFVDEKGNPLPSVSDIFDDPENAVAAYWYQGDVTSEAVLLSPDPVLEGRLVGVLPACELDGDVDVVIAVQGDYKGQYRFTVKNETTQIKRRDMLLTNPVTCIVALVLLILTVVILIIRCIVNRRHPVNGILKLVAAGDAPDEFYLRGRFCSKNKAVLTKQLIPTQEYSDLYRIEAHSVPAEKVQKDGQEDTAYASANLFEVDSYQSNPYLAEDLNEAKNEVKIKLWLISTRKPIQKVFPGKADLEITLRTGEQRPYSDMAATEIKLD